MKTSAQKYVFGAIVVVAVAAYAIWSGNNNGGGTAAIPPLAQSPSTSSPTANQGTSSSSGPSTPAGGSSGGSGGNTAGGGSTASTGQYKDGTYTGSVADAFYGQVQVTATVSGGKLTDIGFPQYPNEPGHTIEESQQALPMLRQEALASQSANVNIISGATQTSQAFQQSLASALAQAKA